jgi:5,10-methylene-tetrahydrofolate dehydrogenase/methenyl tetrahydrofolate cyclohydrolase
VGVEACVTGFRTDLLVAEMHGAMAADLTTLPEGEHARTAFVVTEPDDPNISYALETLAQAEQVPGLATEVWMPDQRGGYQPVMDLEKLREIRGDGLYMPPRDGATLELITVLNDRAGNPAELAGYVALLSPQKRDLNKTIAERVDPESDLDGVSILATRTPATPEAMVDTGNEILRRECEISSLDELDPKEIVVLGNGGVCGPLVSQVLPRRHRLHIPPENHYKNRGDLPEGVKRLATDTAIRLGFSATLACANIEELTPGTALVDFGFAPHPETGRPCGNAHPNLVAQNGTNGKVITAFRGGGGRVTIATVYQRGVARRMEHARSQHLRAA